MTIELSTHEAAEAIGVPTSTLKRWLGDGLPVPVREDSRGARRYGKEAMEVLRRVAQLRDDGRNMASIRLILQPVEEKPPEPEPVPERAEPGPISLGEIVDQAVAKATAGMREGLIATITEQTDLAEKYARAAHEIGMLTARLEAAQIELTRARDELARLAPGSVPARAWWRFWG